MIRLKVILDKRTPKKNGRFPLRLRITEGACVRYIALNADYYENEFNEVMKDFPTQSWKEHRKAIQIIVDKAEKLKNELNPFEFKRFKGLLFQKAKEEKPKTTYLEDLFEEFIKKSKEKNSLRTASLYKTAKNSLLKFHPFLRIEDITETFLNEYEEWFVSKSEKGVITGTIGIYLRNLRAVVNHAIQKELVGPHYKSPFGRN